MNPLLILTLAAEATHQSHWHDFVDMMLKFGFLYFILFLVVLGIAMYKHEDKFLLLDNGKSPESDNEDDDEADSGEDSPAKIVITVRVTTDDEEENTPGQLPKP